MKKFFRRNFNKDLFSSFEAKLLRMLSKDNKYKGRHGRSQFNSNTDIYKCILTQCSSTDRGNFQYNNIGEWSFISFINIQITLAVGVGKSQRNIKLYYRLNEVTHPLNFSFNPIVFASSHRTLFIKGTKHVTPSKNLNHSICHFWSHRNLQT